MQTLRSPDQVRTLFPRDAGMPPRVRIIRQFLVGEGQDEISVIVVWDYDKKDLSVDLLVGRSAHTTQIGDAEMAAEERAKFLNGDRLLYDRRAGPLADDAPKEKPG